MLTNGNPTTSTPLLKRSIKYSLNSLGLKMEISREERKKQLMEFSNMTESEAEFAVAIELGEIDGDVITVDAEGKPVDD
jgi:hypothetical protein